MRLLLMLMILLAFPVVEVLLLVKLAHLYGWWLLAYLLFSAVAGVILINGERMLALARILQVAGQGEHPLFALLCSARNLIAGVLLILPGVLSDVLALLLLLFPLSLLQRRPLQAANDNDFIEAEWRRED